MQSEHMEISTVWTVSAWSPRPTSLFLLVCTTHLGRLPSDVLAWQTEQISDETRYRTMCTKCMAWCYDAPCSHVCRVLYFHLQLGLDRSQNIQLVTCNSSESLGQASSVGVFWKWLCVVLGFLTIWIHLIGTRRKFSRWPAATEYLWLVQCKLTLAVVFLNLEDILVHIT